MPQLHTMKQSAKNALVNLLGGKEKLTLQTPYPNIIQNLCALLGIYLTFARRLIP